MNVVICINCFLLQTRKFVAKDSAGLRIRVRPSLQGEQIGVVHPEGVISFISQVWHHFSFHHEGINYKLSTLLLSHIAYDSECSII